MAKIKRKVEMKQKEFLKHLLEQEETEVELNGYTFDYNEEHYSFDPEITTNEVVSYNPNNNTYTVEVEEEIAEETKIDNLAEFYIDKKGKKRFEQNDDISIGRRLRECIYKPEAFYSLNDDMTMTLIWKDGKLVG